MNYLLPLRRLQPVVRLSVACVHMQKVIISYLDLCEENASHNVVVGSLAQSECSVGTVFDGEPG